MGQRYLPVTADFLIALQTRHGAQTRRLVPYPDVALPDDVKVVRMGHDPFGQINIVLESAEWPNVAEGDPIPMCPHPVMRVVYDEVEK
jgi:hypothetical protein